MRTPEENKIYMKAYYEANKERLLAEMKAKNEANPEIRQAYRDSRKEETRAYNKEYWGVNREKYMEWMKNHREDHPEMDRQYQETHREEHNAATKLYREQNPDKVRAHRLKTFPPGSAKMSWRSMKDRCLNPKHIAFHHYGGRGITVCERWMEFENFLADMGERPDGKTLDRINVSGNYEPGNCRWATNREQALNKRKVGKLEYFTTEQLLAELSRREVPV